jgi:hypothetical protein
MAISFRHSIGNEICQGWDFAATFADLTRCPRAWLDGFVERRPSAAWPGVLAEPGTAPKSIFCF